MSKHSFWVCWMVTTLSAGCQKHTEPAGSASTSAAPQPTAAGAAKARPVLAPGSSPSGISDDPEPRAKSGVPRRYELLAEEQLTWEFATEWGAVHVAVWVPQRAERQRFGALVAFHGRGESLKGSARGVRGWLDDYRIEAAIGRLKRPPLDAADFQNFASSDELARFNERLEKTPYRDVLLIMPYLPDVLKADAVFKNGPKLASFLEHRVLPRAARELPLRTPAAISVDGVSLGGRAALSIALSRPELFVSAGGLQSAIDEKEIARFTKLAKRATERNPSLRLRLLTSDEDYYLGVNRELSSAWTKAGVPHVFRLVSGTHTYEFNRGPGALEMLVFHSRMLAR